MRILITDGMDKAAMAQLRELGHEVVEQFYEPDQLGAALRDFDAVVVRSKTKVRANHIDEAKGGKLKLTMREGKWEKKAYGKGIELQGKTLGIIGFGRIGQHLGVMAKAIGMNVVAYSTTRRPEVEAKFGIPYVTLEELLAQSDFISLHAPAAPGAPLINADTIAKMKDGVVIINTSRGANVDEDALRAALEAGKVRAAGLDVYADEPTANAALYSHPMVSCTPHIGAATVEAQKRIGTEIVDIIRSF